MSGKDRVDVWLLVGMLGAVVLGGLLTPLRTVTSASNLAFAFLALTIVIAEVGGQIAALGTALLSAMSLNFFLTEPYLTLSISKTDDLVAFVALAACGLIAATFGRRRMRSVQTVSRSRQDLDTLQRVARRAEAAEAWGDILDDLRGVFRLGRMTLRHADGRLLATSPEDARATSIPEADLEPATLLAVGRDAQRLGPRGFRLPERGGRLRLGAAPGISLDVWEGDREGLALDERQTLSIAASILGLGLARRDGRAAG